MSNRLSSIFTPSVFDQPRAKRPWLNLLRQRMLNLKNVILIVTFFLLLGCDVLETTTEIASPDAIIKLNQLGFLPSSIKVAIVPAVDTDEFHVVSAKNHNIVYSGKLSGSMQWPPAGDDSIKRAVFSDLKTEGLYFLTVAGLPRSDTFRIAYDVYDKVHNAALKAYYFNRASTSLIARHAGAYVRDLGHPDDKVIVHASAATEKRPAGSTIAAPKGWYDAGDYGKYVVNSGITTYTLLTAYEHYTDFYKNRSLNIPESEDELPDILNEVLWNLDWLEAMQDPDDGGVYHKLTALNFTGKTMPGQATADRYVVQKSTSATLNFAATMAVASRIFTQYKKIYPDKSQRYQEAALKAWRWAATNPEAYYVQPKDVLTGAYGDNELNDEFGWAAAELYILTGDSYFIDQFFSRNLNADEPGWQNVAALGYFSLSQHCSSVLPSRRCKKVIEAIAQTANVILQDYQQSEYVIPLVADNFYWGSNNVALNKAIVLIQAYRNNHQREYLDAAFSVVDYILGRNPTAYSYVTGHGIRPPMNIHHRQSYADQVIAPIPGLLVGGPHSGWEDKCSYPSKYPAKSYLDDWCSFSTNEVAINWNAALVYVLAAVQSL